MTQSVASLGMTHRPLLMWYTRYNLRLLVIANPCPLELQVNTFCRQALNRPDLSPRTRESCLKSLYRTCGRHALLPTTLRIPISYERTGEASYRGGFADVWKGEYRDQEVAVKVIRIYSNTDLQKVAGVSHWLRSVPAYLSTESVPCRGFARRLSRGKPSSIRTSYH